MTARLDFGGTLAADMQDPAALYGRMLDAFVESTYYFKARGYGELPLSFRNGGVEEFQVRFWGHDFQYIDNEYGLGVDTSIGQVSRVEVFGPDDLAADALNPPTHLFILTLGEPASMLDAINAIFVKDFSPLYAGQALEVTGAAQGDRLLGGDLADTLGGRGGADTLDGGAGRDELRGGGGKDLFVFADAGSANADAIKDFAGSDRIALEADVFAALGAPGPVAAAEFKAAADISASGGATVDAGDRLLYDSDSGRLYYDANGSAAGGRVLLATVFDTGTHHPALAAGDFIVI